MNSGQEPEISLEASVEPVDSETAALHETEEAGAGLVPADAAAELADDPEADAGRDTSDSAATIPPARCPDLDANDALDCEETLLYNPSFDVDSNGWLLEQGVSVQWQPEGAAGTISSGAMLIANAWTQDSDANAFGGVFQCFAATEGANYLLAAEVFMDAGQEAGTGGVQALFLPSEDCSGYAIGASSATTGATDVWRVVSTRFTVPGGAKSMKVRLGSSKSQRVQSFVIAVDNALLRIE